MGGQRLSRRGFLLLFAAAVASVLLPALRMIGRLRAVNRPNILFILSDQQRWDTVGCYGQALDVTPNLDRMAAEGVRFENAFTCQPLCGPARACIQTGKYATETGVIRNGIALPLDELTMAHHLSRAGYEVGYIGRWHLASNHRLEGPELDFRARPVPPERRGGYKDYWLASDALEYTSHSYDGHMFNANMEAVHFPEGRYRVDAQTDWVLDYLGTRNRQRPFFLFVSYLEPHHQNDRNRYEGPVGAKERFKDFAVPGDLVGTKGDWRESYPDYLGCVNSLDENLGRIRDELVRLDLESNTLLVFTSDHGCHFRTRNEEYKRSCHDSSIRVPLIAYGPGFRGGKVIRNMVSLIDIAPTVLTAGGVEIPGHMRGRPLQTLIRRTAADWPEEVFVQISVSQIGRAIRTHRWKYSVSAPGRDAAKDPGSDFYVEEFLYDLEADPHERHNLVRSPSHAGIRAMLCERLKRRMAAAGERVPTIVPAH